MFNDFKRLPIQSQAHLPRRWHRFSHLPLATLNFYWETREGEEEAAKGDKIEIHPIKKDFGSTFNPENQEWDLRKRDFDWEMAFSGPDFTLDLTLY